MDIFRELGEEIVTEWEASKWNSLALPSIASKALGSLRLQSWSVSELIDMLLSQAALPKQFNATRTHFGQPPVTVFSHPQFFIDLYFWANADPTIHNHHFSGAFTVLHGTSLHTTYSFQSSLEHGPFIAAGQLRGESIELLKRGDVRPIMIGDALIHRLLHVDCPSISLVVRTTSSTGPYHQYYMPSLRADSLHLAEVTLRRTELLEFLRRTQCDSYLPRLQLAVRDIPPEAVFQILSDHVKDTRDVRTAKEVLQSSSAFPQELLAAIVAALEEVALRDYIMKKRSEGANNQVRFLWSALLGAHSRLAFLKIIADYFQTSEAARLAGQLLGEILAPDGESSAREVIAVLVESGSLSKATQRLQDEFSCGPEVLELATRLAGSALLRTVMG